VWASWQGIPLSALGAATYAAVAAAAVFGATQRSQGTPESLNPARLPLLAGATTLAGVSAYLLLLLATQLQGTTCPYCLTSAALSAGTLACALRGVTAEDRERLGTPSIALAAAVVVTLAVPQVRNWLAFDVAMHTCVWPNMESECARCSPPLPLACSCVQSQAAARQAARDAMDLPFAEPEVRLVLSHRRWGDEEHRLCRGLSHRAPPSRCR
jgi:Vitamin K epoxide reductase family